MRTVNTVSIIGLVALAAGWLAAGDAAAQGADDVKLAQAEKVLHDFTTDEKQGIPIDLPQRAHGVVVIPNLIRGGFFVGGRRGRGVLIVERRAAEQSRVRHAHRRQHRLAVRREAADIVLVLANERSVKNIQDGKFTFGGDATAVAGPRATPRRR
jgi:lipid-binding SYLF domain-containing protein